MATRTRLPTIPESIEALRARYHEALAPTYLIVDERSGEWHGIGQKRKHVFDFDDGLRLIISRERGAIPALPAHQVIIHVSASFDLGSPYIKKITDQVFSLKEMNRFVQRRFRELSADTRELVPWALTIPKGVPHYIIKEGTDRP